MRSSTPWLLAVALGLPAAGAEDEAAAKVAAQKKKAEANWQALEAGPAAMLETKHLLLYAPRALEKRLKAAGPLLEKHYELAAGALGIGPKEGPWPGKLAVYLFPEREPFGAFVRRVEKQRLLPGQTTAYSVEGDEPHAAAMPSPAKAAPPLEGQAGAAVAQALLARKAGKDTPLPAWLVAGFGRATYYRAAPADRAVQAERRQARALSRTRGPADVWGDKLDAAEAEVLGGSLADFLAYGPGAPKFQAFVAGLKPEEDMQARTAAQALGAVGLEPDRVAASWKRWVNR